MFTAKEYVMPQTLDEAYTALMARKTNQIVAGCAWLRMGKRRINTAVDLTDVGLDFIRETDDEIEIGAMTSYRSVETSPLLTSYFNGVLAECVKPIIGTQFRNTVTVGGSVYSRYGFSDFLTPLLALDCWVTLYKGGKIPLADFMQMPYEKDILVMISVKKDGRKASTQMFRNAQADFPIVNLSASKLGNEYRICVGARPEKAIIAAETSKYLSEADFSNPEAVIARAQALLAEEVSFRDNVKASAKYRLTISQVLLKRAILEVEAC